MDIWIGSAVVAVVISSLVTVAGWFMTLRHERIRETERRIERVEDIQTALLADIRSSSHRFFQTDLDAHLNDIEARIRGGSEGEGYTPFVPREPGSLLWESTAAEVHILPTEVIDAVVIYFSQLETIRLFAEDLRAERFSSLDIERKIAMYRDYIKLAKYLVDLAAEAERVLAASLEIELPVNIPASGRSNQSTASG
jgi:hypothetical protein